MSDFVSKFGLSEKLLLLFLILLFILIRNINFTNSLNFSKDPAKFSLEALKIYQDKNHTLIGPTTSIEYHGRFIFQGPLIYYFQLFFLILGEFDPIKASYIFMLFCSLMIIPLYYGVSKLIDRNGALLIVTIYTLFPFFIDYTKFMWNPNFQLSLSPILIFLMGQFKKQKSKVTFLLLSISAGILLQFHYSFILIIIGLIVYYFIVLKLRSRYWLLFVLGLCIGMSPLILFELRNNFYNLRTLLLFVQHWSEIFYNPLNQEKMNHYKLSMTLFLILLTVGLLQKKVGWRFLSIVFISLSIWSFSKYLPEVEKPYGIPFKWMYTDELRTNIIIKEQKLDNFAVTNLIYDTEAEVQKYLLKKDEVEFSSNYKTNKFLFVLTDKEDFLDDQAYEVKSFLPARIIKSWEIKDRYKLYLAKREG